MSDSVRPHRRQPTSLPRPWDSLGKNTGAGCHFLLQCRKVKMKSLSRVRLLATPWIAVYKAPPSMGFSKQEYWSGVPLPSPHMAYRNCYLESSGKKTERESGAANKLFRYTAYRDKQCFRVGEARYNGTTWLGYSRKSHKIYIHGKWLRTREILMLNPVFQCETVKVYIMIIIK